MPIPTHESQSDTHRPSAADNYAERESQVDEIVARLRRLALVANKPGHVERT